MVLTGLLSDWYTRMNFRSAQQLSLNDGLLGFLTTMNLKYIQNNNLSNSLIGRICVSLKVGSRDLTLISKLYRHVNLMVVYTTCYLQNMSQISSFSAIPSQLYLCSTEIRPN